VSITASININITPQSPNRYFRHRFRVTRAGRLQPFTRRLLNGLAYAGWHLSDPFTYMLPHDEARDEYCDVLELPLDQWRDGFREVQLRWSRGLPCHFHVTGPNEDRMVVSQAGRRDIQLILGFERMEECRRWPDFTWYLSKLIPGFEKAGMSIYSISCEASF
jgi:hypothetical protein